MCIEQSADELGLAFDARLLVMDVAAFDGTDRLNSAQGCFGGSQCSKALSIAKQPLHGCVIALNQVVSPLLVDVTDTVKMRA